MSRESLADLINSFLSQHAKKKDGKYVSPDAYKLEQLQAQLLEKDLEISEIAFPFVDFYQGGFKRDGEAEYEEIMGDLEKLKTTSCPHCQTIQEAGNKFCVSCGKPLSAL